MWLWLSFVPFLVLLLCNTSGESVKHRITRTDHIKLFPCPENTVCFIFGHDQECVYKANDKPAKSSYILLSGDRTKTKCYYEDHGYLYARLDIQPNNLTSWKMAATLKKSKYYESKTYKFKIEDVVFDFGDAKLSFTKDAARFSWNEYESSDNQVTKQVPYSSAKSKLFYMDSAEFIIFEFDLSANGKKMIDFVGKKLSLHWDKNIYEIEDSDFPDEIERLTKCDLSEIKSRLVCYDTCNEMLPKPNSIDSSNSTNSTDSSISTNSTESPISTEWLYTKVPPNCPSLLWFHDTSEAGMMRHWRKVDTLECHKGYWQGEWTQHEEGKPPKGIRKFNSTEELQCSSVHPEKLTPQGKIVAGVAGGIGGLLFIGLMALLVLCLVRKRRRRRNAKKFQFGADTTVGSCSTIGLPGKSTEREGTLRDSGTQREEEPTKRAWWSPKKKSSPRVDSSPLKVDSSPAKYENYTPPGTGTHAA